MRGREVGETLVLIIDAAVDDDGPSDGSSNALIAMLSMSFAI